MKHYINGILVTEEQYAAFKAEKDKKLAEYKAKLAAKRAQTNTNAN